MLGNAAGLAGNDIGMAQRIQKRGLAVIDVAHHGHHGRARLDIGRIVDDIEQAFLDVRRGDALDGVTKLLGDQLRGIGIDHVGDLVHRALFHQQPDHVDRAFGHAVGEFLDIDGFRDDHFANELLFRLVRRVPLQALGAAAERRDRALAHVVGIKGGDQGQAPALLRRRRLRGRLRGSRGANDAAGAAPDLARAFILVGDVGGNAGSARGGHRRGGTNRSRGLGFGFAKAFLGFELGLALGLLVLPVAFFFGLAAGFGGFAFGLLDAFLAVAALGFLFGETALFNVADFGVGERAGARRALVLGQGAQHHARIAARRSRRGGGTGERRLDRRRLGHSRFRRMAFCRGGVAADPALAALFDHHLLGAAVAEALANGARLDARLERQGLGRDTESLVARRFRINHTAVLILLRCAYPHSHFMQVVLCKSSSAVRLRILGRFAGCLVVIRYRTRTWLRDRNVLLAGPASRAACTTFDRPSAKSNCSEVSTVTTGNSRDSPLFAVFCRTTASNFLIPSAAPSAAWIRALTEFWACRCSRAPSTLLKPDMTWPALAAMASASITPRTSKLSVSAASVGATFTSRLNPLLNWLRRVASATA